MSAVPESLRLQWQRRLGILNPPIRSPRRHHILYDAIRRRLRNKTEAFLVALEIASFILAAMGQNKWKFLLAACSVSLLAFVTNIVLCARRRTEQLAEQSAGKTLMLVDIFFSLIQFLTTLIYFVLAFRGKKVGFNESLLPLCFAFIRWWISSPPPVPEVTNSDPLPSQIMPIHEVIRSTTIDITTIDIQEGPNPSSSATRMPATDNETMVDDPLPNVNVSSSSSCDSSPATSTTVDKHGVPYHSSPAPHVSPTDNEARCDDPSSNFKVTDSSSCEPLSSTAASTTVDIYPSVSATQILATDNDAKVDDPLPNFKVASSSSSEPFSSLAASTIVDIHGGLNHSSPAPHMSPTDNEAKGDDPLPNFKVTGSSSCEPLSNTAASTTVDIHEGPNPSGSATQILAIDNDAKVDDPLLDFKVTGSSSCEPFSSLVASTTLDVRGGLNHSSPPPFMSPTDNEARGDDPLPNFKVTGSSSYKTLSSSTVSTTVHVHEGSNHSTFATQLPPTDNEAKAGDPLLNFKVASPSSFEPINLSLYSICNDPSPTASTALDIHEELNQSSPAI